MKPANRTRRGGGGDRATVATGTSDEAGRARRSRDLGDVNGVSREGPGSLDGWAVPAGNPAGAEAAVVRGVNVDRRNLARFSFLIPFWALSSGFLRVARYPTGAGVRRSNQRDG